jgi:hypothetical protein
MQQLAKDAGGCFLILDTAEIRCFAVENLADGTLQRM